MLHTFYYDSYEKYLEAYTALVRICENFYYTRDINLIEVLEPDEELISILQSFQ